MSREVVGGLESAELSGSVAADCKVKTYFHD